jgi:hypothetical protein
MQICANEFQFNASVNLSNLNNLFIDISFRFTGGYENEREKVKLIYLMNINKKET